MLAGGLHARSYSNIHLACGPLGLGEDCAGLGSIGLAFKELDIPFKYNFASEKEDAIRCIHHTLHPELETKLFFNDLAERDNKKAPGCHVYGFGGPCQPWSPAGKEEGINDARGCVLFNCMDYVKQKRPPLIVMENVASLMHKYKPVLDALTKLLSAYGYEVKTKELNTADFGLPQHRVRVYLIAVHTTCLWCPITFPTPEVCSTTTKALLSKTCVSHWGSKDKSSLPSNACQKLRQAKKEAKARGISPRKEDVFVDVDAGKGFHTMIISLRLAPLPPTTPYHDENQLRQLGANLGQLWANFGPTNHITSLAPSWANLG